MKAILTEIACFTPGAALTAENSGAHRIELCSGYSEGGLSPSAASIMLVRHKVKIPVHVMIRPRAGDFIYSDFEKEVILADVDFCRNNGIDGIVTGVLKADGNIDKEFTRMVIDRAKPMSVTFHRAFDLTTDLFKALSDLIDCGATRLLTSGAKQNAILGAPTIAQLVNEAGTDLIILPGGGLNPDNIIPFIELTRVKEVHFSAKKLVKSPALMPPNISLTSYGDVDDTQWFESDRDLIKQMVEMLGTGKI